MSIIPHFSNFHHFFAVKLCQHFSQTSYQTHTREFRCKKTFLILYNIPFGGLGLIYRNKKKFNQINPPYFFYSQKTITRCTTKTWAGVRPQGQWRAEWCRHHHPECSTGTTSRPTSRIPRIFWWESAGRPVWSPVTASPWPDTLMEGWSKFY